jgi:hypothetical protein
VPDAGPSLGLFGIHISSDGHASSVPNEKMASWQLALRLGAKESRAADKGKEIFTTKTPRHQEKAEDIEQEVTEATEERQILKPVFFCSLCFLLVRQAKLDGSCQLQGTDQGSCSFAL